VADKKHYIALPQGRKLTREEAKDLGRKLFDSITTEQADTARKDEKKRKK